MSDPDDIRLVYDRECPVCDFYCRRVRVDDSAGRLELVDARDASALMQRITDTGLDIDEGMVLAVGDELYYGDEAIHRLALMTTRSGFFNRFAAATFRSRRRARWLYPVLKACRNGLLKLLGRTRINNLHRPGKERF